MTSHVDALLLGGGVGRRFLDGTLPKQFHLVENEPVFLHSVRSLEKLECIRRYVLVMPAQYLGMANDFIQKLDSSDPLRQKIELLEGGHRRQDSSRLGIERLESRAPDRVLIHDACRPYLSLEFIHRIREAIFNRAYGAWVPIIPVTDTLKRVQHNLVMETVDRDLVHRVQTPQIFEYSVIRSLTEKTAGLDKQNFTDDASLCEYYGIPVGTFEGDVRNIKLTYDFEFPSLQSMLQDKPSCELESDTTSTV